MKSDSKTSTLDNQGKLLFVFMVVVGHIVNFAFIVIEFDIRVTGEEIALGILLGIIYLLLGLNDRAIFDRLPAGWANILFFSIQCFLLFSQGMLLFVVGTLLMGVPLVGFAVERLKPWGRLLVYAGVVAAVVLPIGLRHDTWTSALFNGITVSMAILFVAVFAQMRLNEQQAREHAESLMKDLELANAQLAAYATQAEELAMTQERNRLAREIHDNLGHYLTIVNVQIEAAKVVMASEPERALDALNKAQELAQKGLAQVRDSVSALRESPVTNRPLSEAITSLVAESQRTGIVTEFEVAGEVQPLGNKVALALYRVVQEGLTNVRRHARASRVDVTLDFRPGEVRLAVKDNGVGAAEISEGFGLLGIRERMKLLGGKMEILTSSGQGFCLTASVPLQAVYNRDTPEGQE